MLGCCCCCGKGRRAAAEDDTIELSSVTNAAVTLKSGAKGEAVVVAPSPDGSSYCVSGRGTVLGSCVLDCDVGMWEVRIGKGAAGVRVGVRRYNAKRPTPLGGAMGEEGTESWAFPSFANGGKDLEEGDVVSVFWDQTDLPLVSFAVNGVPYPDAAVKRIRPSSDIYPAVSVDDGSSCELVFDGAHFKHTPAGSKFKMVICATNLI